MIQAIVCFLCMIGYYRTWEFSGKKDDTATLKGTRRLRYKTDTNLQSAIQTLCVFFLHLV